LNFTGFEGNPFEISNKYAFLIKSMWVTGFYAPLLPILLLIAIGGLAFMYWVDRLLFKIRFNRPKLISADINNAMIGIFF
jgi:hypothetical protein